MFQISHKSWKETKNDEQLKTMTSQFRSAAEDSTRRMYPTYPRARRRDDTS